MKKVQNVWTKLYWILPILIFCFDRFTKYWVMYHLPFYKLNDYMSVSLTFNRGISFGMFHSQSNVVFAIVNCMILSVMVALLVYMYQRMREGKIILAELCVLTGAICNNLIDRFLYAGVVDFISLSYGSWYFPVFNVADIAICCGVCVILLVEIVWHQES